MIRKTEATATEWDNYYDKGQVSWQSSGLSPYLRKYLRKYGNGHELLEVGCGTGEDVKDLLALRYHYYGIDLSGRAIQLAQSNHPAAKATFLTGDFFQRQTSKKFSVVYDKGTFHNLKGPQRRTKFVKLVSNYLQPDGIWITVSGSADHYDSTVQHGAIFLQHLIEPVEPYFEILEIVKAPYGTVNKKLDFPAWHCVFRKR